VIIKSKISLQKLADSPIILVSPNPKVSLGFGNWDLFGSIDSIGDWDF